jgi:hypothetical protein
MKECIGSIQRCENKLLELKEKLADDRKLYDAQQKNETTFRGVWLKITGKTKTSEQLRDAIVETEHFIEENLKLKSFVEAYVWVVVVPRFCAYRGKQYLDFILTFGGNFLIECDHKIEKWNTVIERTNDLVTDKSSPSKE